MGLIIFLAGGAILGWLAAIVLRVERGSRIMALIGVGSLGAVIGGVIGNRGSILSGISAISIATAIAGALILIGVLALLRNRFAGRDG